MANLEDAAHFLRGADKILILSHRSPDGDTLGALRRSAAHSSRSANRSCSCCADPVPPKFTYLFEGIEYGEFEPEHIVTVDVADKTLLGSLEPYGDKTDFAIDHHASCRPFAKETWVEGTAGAACELIARLIPALGAEITPKIADCLYTGISTDTGCFRYPNASANTYRIAADLLEHGANAAEINRLMFDTKSRAAVALLKRLYGNMEFHCDGKCAVFCLTNDVIAETGASEDDLRMAFPPWCARWREFCWALRCASAKGAFGRSPCVPRTPRTRPSSAPNSAAVGTKVRQAAPLRASLKT